MEACVHHILGVHHDREKHHVTMQAPKAVPFLTVTTGTVLFNWQHFFILITDLCSLKVISSPWSCGTVAVNTVVHAIVGKHTVCELCTVVGRFFLLQKDKEIRWKHVKMYANMYDTVEQGFFYLFMCKN